MNEVWSLREKQPPSPTPPSPETSAASTFPFKLPERRSTLRALIEEFRRGEHEYQSGQWSSSSFTCLPAAVGGPTSWTGADALARGQLLKGSQQQQQWQNSASRDGEIKKSTSVWYAAPPAPNRSLVTQLSMPNMRMSRTQERQPQTKNPNVEQIPEEQHWSKIMHCSVWELLLSNFYSVITNIENKKYIWVHSDGLLGEKTDNLKF